VISNPKASGPHVQSVDVASKVGIQRLKQELMTAQNSLAVIPNANMEMVVQDSKMMKEFEEMKEENEKMKEHGSFEWWKKKCFEAHAERDHANKEKFEALNGMREEEKMFKEEETEARRNSEDVERLCREGNGKINMMN